MVAMRLMAGALPACDAPCSGHGSAVHFDPHASDIDFLVDFQADRE